MRGNRANDESVRGPLPRRDVEFTGGTGIVAMNDVVGAVVTCKRCGAAIWFQENGRVDPVELHRRWHRRLER